MPIITSDIKSHVGVVRNWVEMDGDELKNVTFMRFSKPDATPKRTETISVQDLWAFAQGRTTEEDVLYVYTPVKEVRLKGHTQLFNDFKFKPID